MTRHVDQFVIRRRVCQKCRKGFYTAEVRLPPGAVGYRQCGYDRSQVVLLDGYQHIEFY